MNSPTILTLTRILLIPVLMAISALNSIETDVIALAVFLLASLTDWLDGFLARKRNQVTILGKLLDPLADKLLVLSAFLILLDQDAIWVWVVVLMIGREMTINGLRAFLAAEQIILAASRLGKWKMTFQVIALSFLFLHRVHPYFHFSGLFFMLIALILSYISGFCYLRKFWQRLGKKILAEQAGSGNDLQS
jgi:CDP-diacylglycerol--glycerol-3-phosphate 3-phosphatidyltransferase